MPTGHAYRPCLPAMPTGHAYRPCLPAMPTGHAYRPCLPAMPTGHAFLFQRMHKHKSVIVFLLHNSNEYMLI